MKNKKSPMQHMCTDSNTRGQSSMGHPLSIPHIKVPVHISKKHANRRKTHNTYQEPPVKCIYIFIYKTVCLYHIQGQDNILSPSQGQESTLVTLVIYTTTDFQVDSESLLWYKSPE